MIEVNVFFVIASILVRLLLGREQIGNDRIIGLLWLADGIFWFILLNGQIMAVIAR